MNIRCIYSKWRLTALVLAILTVSAGCANNQPHTGDRTSALQEQQNKRAAQSHAAQLQPKAPPLLHQTPLSAVQPVKPLQTMRKPGLAFIPTRLLIPAIKVKAAVDRVTVEESGHMGVPAKLDHVGILYPGVKPGQAGNAIIDGHVDSYTGPAIFFRLKHLKTGNQIILKDDKGHQLIYSVESVEAFKTEEAPLDRIFGQTAERRLNLITCTGKYSRSKKEHQMRLVVFAKLSDA
jgi:LPXTG-site transpeptidase (sortase) family protein